ncbi:hypothetical protein DL767_010967 [Monosporascus sp. MG133]|nr:hypothetical protein DL767_010967 [Monosporascus sp. MG133]
MRHWPEEAMTRRLVMVSRRAPPSPRAENLGHAVRHRQQGDDFVDPVKEFPHEGGTVDEGQGDVNGSKGPRRLDRVGPVHFKRHACLPLRIGPHGRDLHNRRRTHVEGSCQGAAARSAAMGVRSYETRTQRRSHVRATPKPVIAASDSKCRKKLSMGNGKILMIW